MRDECVRKENKGMYEGEKSALEIRGKEKKSMGENDSTGRVSTSGQLSLLQTQRKPGM